jgi:hypothetical protein
VVQRLVSHNLLFQNQFGLYSKNMSGGDDYDIDTVIGKESTTPQASNVIAEHNQSKNSKLIDGTVYANINDTVIIM